MTGAVVRVGLLSLLLILAHDLIQRAVKCGMTGTGSYLNDRATSKERRRGGGMAPTMSLLQVRYFTVDLLIKLWYKRIFSPLYLSVRKVNRGALLSPFLSRQRLQLLTMASNTIRNFIIHPRHRMHLVFGANTDVGKSIVSVRKC